MFSTVVLGNLLSGVLSLILFALFALAVRAIAKGRAERLLKKMSLRPADVQPTACGHCPRCYTVTSPLEGARRHVTLPFLCPSCSTKMHGSTTISGELNRQHPPLE